MLYFLLVLLFHFFLPSFLASHNYTMTLQIQSLVLPHPYTYFPLFSLFFACSLSFPLFLFSLLSLLFFSFSIFIPLFSLLCCSLYLGLGGFDMSRSRSLSIGHASERMILSRPRLILRYKDGYKSNTFIFVLRVYSVSFDSGFGWYGHYI